MSRQRPAAQDHRTRSLVNLPTGAVTWTPPERTLRGNEGEHVMKSDTDEEMTAKERRFAKPRAMGCAVVIAVVLAVILAWALGFFTWLLS